MELLRQQRNPRPDNAAYEGLLRTSVANTDGAIVKYRLRRYERIMAKPVDADFSRNLTTFAATLEE